MGGDSAPDLITKVKGVGRPWIGGHWESWRGWKKFSKVGTSVCALIERGVGILLKEAYGSSRPGCPTR